MRMLDHMGEEIVVGDRVWLRSPFFTEARCKQLFGLPNPEFVVCELVPPSEISKFGTAEIQFVKTGKKFYVQANELYVIILREWCDG